MANHKTLSGAYVDNVGWIQSTDPTAGDEAGEVVAGRCWIDNSTSPYTMKIRNATNTAWVQTGTVSSSNNVMLKLDKNSAGDVEWLVSTDGGTNWKHDHFTIMS